MLNAFIFYSLLNSFNSIDPNEISDWNKFVGISGYKYWDETKNDTYKLFLGASN